MGASISFDHAADEYDATRALPADVVARQTDVLLRESEAAGADRLLEVGIGTGRIARPLAERGLRVVGIDIAPRMLARLREQLGPRHTRPDLLLGDATALPLAADSVRAVLMVHVLHLVSSWRDALEEMRRVLAPGGVFLHDVTHYSENNPWQRVFQKREQLLGELGFTPRRRPGHDAIAAFLEDLGGSGRRVVYAERDEVEVAREVVDRARRKVDSWTWEIPEAIYPTFLEQYEQHVREAFGGLEATNTTHLAYGLDVWSFG